jgi:hypothetical protein
MMAPRTYAPTSATLLILFTLARARLMTAACDAASLSDEWLISATEDMNNIADVIRDAADTSARKQKRETERLRELFGGESRADHSIGSEQVAGLRGELPSPYEADGATPCAGGGRIVGRRA